MGLDDDWIDGLPERSKAILAERALAPPPVKLVQPGDPVTQRKIGLDGKFAKVISESPPGYKLVEVHFDGHPRHHQSDHRELRKEYNDEHAQRIDGAVNFGGAIGVSALAGMSDAELSAEIERSRATQQAPA